MPISPPRLDDRDFEDLVDELLARIPAHTPEWVPQPGDPGRTLLELFAWLGETILYRANLIPERQRLAFLRLLGQQMLPARAASGIISLYLDEPEASDSIAIGALSKVPAAVTFETRNEINLLPVRGECYYKRQLSQSEQAQSEVQDVLTGLREFHEIDGELAAYVSTQCFEQGLGDSSGIDLVQDSTDSSLWIALLAPTPALVAAVKDSLSGVDVGRASILNVGLAPAIEMPDAFDDDTRPGRIPHVWEISTNELYNDNPVYSQLTRIADSSDELTRRGVQRLIMPGDPEDYGVLEGDVRIDANAGVGDRPPRLDDPDKIARIVAWLRLRPALAMTSMKLGWTGINALEIDHLQTIRGRLIGQSNGLADQLMRLPASSVDDDSFELQVEESGRGYVRWQQVDDLALMNRDDAVFTLDKEAGSVSFGNGITGRIPETGRRVRVALMRAGGGSRGNLPPLSLMEIQPHDLDGNRISRKIAVIQGIATQGGEDAEDLSSAEKRIPARLQHRNRCVTTDDYHSLVTETPGIKAGRIEVLPRFMPQQRRFEVPGVVTVMVLPDKSLTEAPNPRPDQPFIEKVYSHLDSRRPLSTELYVIGCEYVPLGLGVGIRINDGEAWDQVINNVRQALKGYLWSLAPLGPNGSGWPLGKSVKDRELEIVAARVSGVSAVIGINLFKRNNNAWQKVERLHICDPIEISLQSWQLPELLSIVISTDDSVSDDLLAPSNVFTSGGSGSGDGSAGVAVPIIPDVC
jgi:predicted phage baseplate assembly protein